MQVEISDEDAATVRAILLTHAEMQDQQAIQNEQERGTMHPLSDNAASLKQDHDEIVEDRDNLQRIAILFGAD